MGSTTARRFACRAAVARGYSAASSTAARVGAFRVSVLTACPIVRAACAGNFPPVTGFVVHARRHAPVCVALIARRAVGGGVARALRPPSLGAHELPTTGRERAHEQHVARR